MAKRATSAPAEKEAYLLLVETESEKPISEDHKYLISKLVADKIFSETEDDICITRFGSNRSRFVPPSWELLKNFNSEFGEKARPSERPPVDVSTGLSDACKVLNCHATQDVYYGKKILLFGQFKTELNKKKIQDLVKLAETSEIVLTHVFPKHEEMNEIQRKNLKILQVATENSENVFVCDFEGGLAKLVNKVAIKNKKSMPSKFELQIGSQITIPVKKLIINRKVSLTYDKYKKEQKSSSAKPTPSQPIHGTSGVNVGQSQVPVESQPVPTGPGGPIPGTTANDTNLPETRRLEIQKEVLWKTSKGDEVQDTKLQEGYMYGGEIVPEEEGTMVAEPTEQNLKVLVFCPRENIPPVYLTGDGTDIYFPQDNNDEAKAIFHALLNALDETNCVAIVRYVWRKNTAVNMHVMIPDLERMGLIASEVCYADDVGIPSFPPLVQENVSNRITQAQDALMDQLIEASSMPEFNPEYGPMNPQTIVFRDKIINSVFREQTEYAVHKKYNTIDLLFDKHEIPEDLMQKLREEFPLIVKKNTADARPAGHQVFRKRHHSEEDVSEDEKKFKMGTDKEEVLVVPEPMEDEDVDALLDEL